MKSIGFSSKRLGKSEYAIRMRLSYRLTAAAALVVVGILVGFSVLRSGSSVEPRNPPVRNGVHSEQASSRRPSTKKIHVARGTKIRAATRLRSATACSNSEPGRAVANLSWKPALEHGSGQRVIVTIFPNGFDTGRFDRSPLLAPTRSHIQWPRVNGQAIHFWRVLTRHGRKWTATITARFRARACVADLIPGS
jgi:hypothetical protein